jgi:putative PIN family toxin of toxin-antitoxin system
MVLRLVIDTNVLVAALLHPGRTPDRAIEAILGGGGVVLCDRRIEAEYREVLGRRKFAAIPVERREGLLRRLLAGAESIASRPLTAALIDEDDRVFVEVGLSGRADAIVTGNPRHFPRNLGVEVLSPAELLGRLTGG